MHAHTSAPPVRLVIVTDAWAPQINGVVTTLRTVIEELQHQGHEILIISPADFKTIPCPTYPEIRLALLARRRVAKAIDDFEPNAVHVATEGPLGMAARRYCIQKGRPFTTSLHTRFPEYIRLRLPFIPLRWGYAFLRWFHGPAACTMVAAPSLAQELNAHGLEHLAIWSRGVDLEVFQPRQRDLLHAQRPIFMYMGRVAVEKNLDAFLELDLPGTKYVVGDGPDLAKLKARFPTARFTGYKTGIELAHHLSCADAFVFPSRTDTFGLVLLEAMACGVPVAAFPVQGPADIIRNGENGYVNEDLRQAALGCLGVPRTACRAFALDYSWGNSARQFLANLSIT